MDQRLAAGDRHHRRAAFVGGIPAFLRRHAAIEDRVGIVDLAAADACEVAAKQRLQHQHQRIALSAQQFLLDQIAADAHFLEERYCHYKFSFWTLSREVDQPARVSSAGSRNSIFSSRPGQHRHRNRPDPSQRLDHVIDKNFGRRGAGGDADGLGVLQPIRVQLAAIGNRDNSRPRLRCRFREACSSWNYWWPPPPG